MNVPKIHRHQHNVAVFMMENDGAAKSAQKYANATTSPSLPY